MSNDRDTLASQLAAREELIEEYNQIDRSQLTKTDLLLILQKHNEVWRSDPAKYWGNSEIESVNFVSDQVPEFVREKLHHPFFNRMNFIHQLSTTYLQRNLGATHTRLSHSYGVTATTKAFIRAIESDGVEIPEEAKQAAYTYAYIHDSFHGPFGHSLSLLKNQFTDISFDNKKLDKNLLSDQLSEGTILYQILQRNLPEDRVDEILEILEFFVESDDPEKQRQYGQIYYLSQVLDSKLDADRLDYLFRDTHNLKQTGPIEETELGRLIRSVEVNPIHTDANVPVRGLTWPKESSNIIEDLIKKRRDLYANFYETAGKIAVDEMITHGIYYFLEYFGINSKNGYPDSDIMKEIVLLTDNGLFEFFNDINRPFISKELVRDVYTGSFHEPIWEFELNYPAEDRDNRIQTANKRILDEIDFSSSFRFDKRTAKKYREILNTVDGGLPFDEYLFILVENLLDRYHQKTNVEQLFWKKVIDDEDLFNIYRRSMYDKYGMCSDLNDYSDLSDDLYNHFRMIPQMFISIPTYITKEKRENKEWIKEGRDEEIYWHETAPKSGELDIPLREEFQSKRIVISGPKPFAEEDARKKIEEKFKHFITEESDEWLVKETFNRR